MDTVLTLNLDQDVVENAEVYAKYTKRSVSKMVEEYLQSIPAKDKIYNDRPLGSITRQLAGIITLDDDLNRKESLTDALMDKHL